MYALALAFDLNLLDTSHHLKLEGYGRIESNPVKHNEKFAVQRWLETMEPVNVCPFER